MKFDDARSVEMICYQLRESDWVRGQNRARINDLFNGAPPYSQQEVAENKIKINVNDLSATRAGHNARAQYYSAFLQQDRFFSAATDMGPRHKRSEYNIRMTSNVAKVMKRGHWSLNYFEKIRSGSAQLVLHGIGPGAWDNRDTWCPDAIGIDDVLIPADTLLTMKNLPFYATHRSYTGPELIRLTSGPKVDPGWNMPLIKACIKWLDDESRALLGVNWPEYWSPEKQAERAMDPGFYGGDRVPTIDVYDFYYWSDDKKQRGWRRRMFLDPWSTPEPGSAKYNPQRRSGDLYAKPNDFIFNPKGRVYAENLSELISFQFADLSAVAPFRYHSVRSLGKLLYAVCHLQNRTRSAWGSAVFESLMQYFRIAGEDDFQRAMKVELIDKGFLPPGVQMLTKAERWQVDANLAQMALNENRALINDSTAAYAQSTNFSTDRTEKTKFQVMAELQGMTHMLNAGLVQAYAYQLYEYKEIFRRLLNPKSQDPDVRAFRANCLRQRFPEKLLTPEAWEISPEEILGGGNQSLQMAQAEQLLAMRPLYDPEAQRKILRDVTYLVTGSATKTKEYVPDGPPKITDSVHDAQMALGSILQGLTVSPVSGQNHVEIVETWLAEMTRIVQGVDAAGGVPTGPEQMRGLQNLGKHIAEHIVIIAANPEEKQRVKIYGDILGKLMNQVKAFGQRLEEKMASENGGLDPKITAEIQRMIILAEAKAANMREQSQQKQAQNALKFEQSMRERQIEFNRDMQERQIENAQDVGERQVKTMAEIGALDAKTAAEIKREEAKPDPKPASE